MLSLPIDSPTSAANMSTRVVCNTTVRRLTKPVVEYKECQRNHAASLGLVSVDGCQEFIQLGAEGSTEPMICAACNCHRNFHKREVQHLPVSSPNPVHASAPAPAPAPARARPVRPSVPSMNNIGGSERAAAEMRLRKARIRFTTEQKAQLMNFAVRIGWRTRHTPESLIENFCREIGITRRVLRDWLSNNRHLRHSTAAMSADGAGTA